MIPAMFPIATAGGNTQLFAKSCVQILVKLVNNTENFRSFIELAKNFAFGNHRKFIIRYCYLCFLFSFIRLSVSCTSFSLFKSKNLVHRWFCIVAEVFGRIVGVAPFACNFSSDDRCSIVVSHMVFCGVCETTVKFPIKHIPLSVCPCGNFHHIHCPCIRNDMTAYIRIDKA